MLWLCYWKWTSQAKILVKFVWKLLKIPFFQYVVCDQGRDKGTQFFGVGCIQQKGVVQKFWLAGELPQPQFHLLVGHSDLTIKNTLWRVLGLLTVMNLKRVSESIFFQSNKFTGYKVKNEKEVANSLMVFNLLKITHLAQGKKNLRT